MTGLHVLGHLDAMERRYSFAAWPQSHAHASWFELLDEAVGLKVSRECNRTIGVAAEAVAQALLDQVDARSFERLAIDHVPTWALQAYGPMRRHLSVVAALCVVPVLRLAVSGAEARQWDGILGPDVRHMALLLWRTNSLIEPPAQAVEIRRSALAAAKSAGDWERFCLSLGLTALAEYNSALRARVRLAWPCVLRDVEPLAAEAGIQSWLVAACLHVTPLSRVDHSVGELAT